MSDPNIKLMQRGLRGLDYDPGPDDGFWGPRTLRANQALIANGGRRAATPTQAAQIGLMLYQGSARHPVRQIVIHCAATQPLWMSGSSLAAKVAEIRRWHVQGRGWRDIGYHWIIDRDGKLATGRAEEDIGAGVEGHNQGVIHICLLGGHGAAATDRFDRHFTRAQDIALRDLISGVSIRTRIDRVSGHNEWAAKACPGFNVPNWLREAA